MSDPPLESTSSPPVGRLGMTPEQLKWLMSKLSSDDQEDLSKVMKACTSEMTLTRGLPFAAATMFSLWFARNRLPEKYWIGPKSTIPFYMLIGFGSVTAANLLSMNTCADRVKPKLASLYEKYNNLPTEAGIPNRYAQLREQNRHGPTLGTILEQQRNAEVEYTKRKAEENKKEAAKYVWDERGPLLSGTPSTRNPNDIPSDQFAEPSSTSGGSVYGDKDFS